MNKINKKRIGIDARFYGPVGKGLGRYTQEIVDNILKIDKENDYVIFLRKENFDELLVDKNSNVKKVLTDLRWYSWKEQILMPYYIWKEKLDLVHFPHFNVPLFVPTKFIVTIHDLILTKFKTIRASTKHPLIYNIKNWAYRLVIKRALTKSIKILTVSNFTKNDIIEKFKISSEKIKVIYEGVANLSKGRDSLFVAKLKEDEVLREYNIANPFLLYVGNAYPHKNLEFLIKCFLKVYKNNNDLRLVLVGKEDYFYKKIKEFRDNFLGPELEDIVIFTAYVPDEKLEILYQEAKLYVFPSLYEGFGLPPLEAMARSCPVLSSNTSSMPEILGEAALYFNPKDESDFLSQLDKILNNNDIRDKMIELGKEQSKKYSWWDCAFNTWKNYF